MPVITQTSIRRLHMFSNLTSVWNWMLLSLGVANFEQATALRHHAGRVSLCVDVWGCDAVKSSICNQKAPGSLRLGLDGLSYLAEIFCTAKPSGVVMAITVFGDVLQVPH